MLRSNSDGSRKNCERGPVVKIKYGGPPPPHHHHPGSVLRPAHLLASINFD